MGLMLLSSMSTNGGGDKRPFLWVRVYDRRGEAKKKGNVGGKGKARRKTAGKRKVGRGETGQRKDEQGLTRVRQKGQAHEKGDKKPTD